MHMSVCVHTQQLAKHLEVIFYFSLLFLTFNMSRNSAISNWKIHPFLFPVPRHYHLTSGFLLHMFDNGRDFCQFYSVIYTYIYHRNLNVVQHSSTWLIFVE